MHISCCCSSDIIGCHGILGHKKKKLQIRSISLWTFIILDNFIWQHLLICNGQCSMTSTHIYIFSIPIYKYNVHLSIKNFLCKICFHLNSLSNLAFISHSYAVAIHIQMFPGFNGTLK